MNPLFIFSSILIVVCITSVCSKSPVSPFTAASGKYVSSYDHLDVGHLLKNDKLVTAYIKCFMDEGPCTKEGKQVKNTLLPDIISTVCSKCSQKQRNMARQVLTNIYQKRRSDFERIMEKYDADDKYDEIITFMNESEPETKNSNFQKHDDLDFDYNSTGKSDTILCPYKSRFVHRYQQHLFRRNTLITTFNSQIQKLQNILSLNSRHYHYIAMVCKTFVLLSCVIYACVAAPGDSANPDDDIKDLGTYMKRFDKINVEQILNNDRVLSSHLKCFLNEGPCVQQSRDLKRVIPVIADNACDGCTQRQKAVIKKSLNTLKNKKPNEWSRLVKIYDASGEKLNKFLES